MVLFIFFFQAEDGIRDHCVTGVQTCALPIYEHAIAQDFPSNVGDGSGSHAAAIGGVLGPSARGGERTDPEEDAVRSEERRVGKECRSRGWAEQEEERVERVIARRR